MTLPTQYPTDKIEHGYIPLYEQHLPSIATRILEIGCLHGESLRMWRDAYPDAEIHCLDLFEENPIPDIPGVTFWKGSQTDTFILEQLSRLKFDVVIEDGSHNSIDQLITFSWLIGSTELYVVEDLQCCKEEFYRQGLPYEFTLLAMLKQNRLPATTFLYLDKIGFIYAPKP